MQYPVEVPGVPLEDLVGARATARRRRRDLHERDRAEATRARRAPTSSSTRGVNVEFSGGEKKRAETLQLAVLEPKFAVLDEIDSGLDVDALRDVARRVEAMTHEDDARRARDHALRAAAHRAAARPRARVPGRPRRHDAAAPSSPTSSRRPATTASRAPRRRVEALGARRTDDPFADPGF